MRIAVAAAGAALIAVGVRGAVLDLDAAGWLAWLAGAAVLHDGVVVPAVLAAGLATRRLPAACRGAVRAALVTAACVTAVALPLVLGHGRRADEPSRLPLPYDRNLAAVLAAIAAAAAITAGARALMARAPAGRAVPGRAAAAVAARVFTGRVFTSRRREPQDGAQDGAHQDGGPPRPAKKGRA